MRTGCEGMSWIRCTARINDLEKVAFTDREEARDQLIEMLKDEAAQAFPQSKTFRTRPSKVHPSRPRRLYRHHSSGTATEHAIENCVFVINIESEDVKGKDSIGREEVEHIRALEAATGIEIVGYEIRRPVNHFWF